MIDSNQAATEWHIAAQIECRDENVLLDYAQYCAEAVSEDQLRNLLYAMLIMDDRVWGFMMAQILGHSRLMHAALDDLAHALEKQRAGFTEQAARALLKEMEP